MGTAPALTLSGGLLMALISNWYQTKVMGDAGLGIGVWAPAKDSPEWREKQRLRRLATLCFWIGILLTALGVALQTAGAVWPTIP
jgi:uncharacterized membrane protein